MKYLPLRDNTNAESPIVRDWRPWPLRTPFLVGFIVLWIFTGLTIELVLWICSPNGCPIVGSHSTFNVSTTSDLVYRQLPSIISIGLGLLWAVVHHDILRMEPYFQMSRPSGAKATESILLDYPYTFSLAVPLKAAKSRHYIVLLSSCILLICNFIIAPMIAGLFDQKLRVQYSPDKATRGALYTRDNLFSVFSAGFSYLAYGYWFSNASLPAFTTPTYAVLPVKPPITMAMQDETWKANTTLFEVDLECKEIFPVPLVHPKYGQYGLQFTGPGQEENISFVLWDSDVMMTHHLQIGDMMVQTEYLHMYWYGLDFLTPWTSIASQFNQTALFIWASSSDPTQNRSGLPRKVTAITCLPTFYEEDVAATFAMPAGDIITVEHTGARTELNAGIFTDVLIGLHDDINLHDNGPSASRFGHMPPQLLNIDSQLRKRLGPGHEIPNKWQVYSDTKFVDYKEQSSSVVGMEWVKSISGFVVNNKTLDSLENLLDPSVLAQEYKKTLQLLFSLAVTAEIVNDTAAEDVTIARGIPVMGFNADYVGARGTQAGLALVALMTAMLLFLNRQRPCKLDGEPNSLAATLRMLAVSPKLSKSVENSEFHSPEDLVAKLDTGETRYKLQLIPGQGPMVQVDSNVNDCVGMDPPHDEGVPWAGKGLWPLRAASQIGLLTFLIGVATLLGALFERSHSLNGISSPGSSSSRSYKILFTYIPYGISKVIEPVLVTLGSLYCMLGPYKRLHQGYATASRSLTIDYDKSPPHFQLLRAARVGDMALATLTAMIVLANVLAVALAGLFSPITIELRTSTQMLTYGIPAVRQPFTDPAMDMNYQLAGILSNRTTTPMWVTPDYYALPFTPVDLDGVQEYEGRTPGIGADIRCNLVAAANMNLTCSRLSLPNIDCSIPSPDKSGYFDLSVDDSCWMHNVANPTRTSPSTVRTGQFNATTEFFAPSVNCSDTFFVAWVYWQGIPYPIDAVVLKCSLRAKLVELAAAVDLRNKTVNPIYTRAFDVHESNTTITHLTTSFINQTFEAITARTWSNYHELEWFDFLMTTLNPSIIGKGETHTNNITDIITTFEDVFRRLFVLNLELYAQDVLDLGETYKTPGSKLVQITKVSMNTTMFYIAISILLCTIGAIGALYLVDGPKFIISHMPKSLAGTYVLLYASNAKEDCVQDSGMGLKEAMKKLEECDGRYSYGKFEAGDGRIHLGVYREKELKEE